MKGSNKKQIKTIQYQSEEGGVISWQSWGELLGLNWGKGDWEIAGHHMCDLFMTFKTKMKQINITIEAWCEIVDSRFQLAMHVPVAYMQYTSTVCS